MSFPSPKTTAAMIRELTSKGRALRVEQVGGPELWYRVTLIRPGEAPLEWTAKLLDAALRELTHNIRTQAKQKSEEP